MERVKDKVSDFSRDIKDLVRKSENKVVEYAVSFYVEDKDPDRAMFFESKEKAEKMAKEISDSMLKYEFRTKWSIIPKDINGKQLYGLYMVLDVPYQVAPSYDSYVFSTYSKEEVSKRIKEFREDTKKASYFFKIEIDVEENVYDVSK